MAKTVEQKAAAAVAKAEAKPTPANVAAAAKAVAVASGATKQEAKAAAAEVKTAVNTIKNTQQLEIKALKQESGSSAAKVEKAANTDELNTFLSGMLSNDFKPTIPTITQASTYDGATSAAYARVNDAYDVAQQYNLAPGKVSGDTTTGIPLHRVDTYLQSDGEKGGLVKKVLDFRGLLDEAVKDGALTNEDIVAAAKDAGVKRSEERLMKQLETKGFIKFGDTSGSDVNYATTSFTKDPTTGSYIPTGTDKYAYDAPSQSSGLFGTIATIASMIPGPWQPFAMAANAAYQASQGNYLSAIFSALGANSAFAGTDAMVLADAKSLADQGLSLSQISDTLGQTYGMNSVANLTNAAAGTIASGVGGIYDSVTGQIKDATGNIIGNPDSIAALPADQVNAMTQGYTPSYNTNFGTPTNVGGFDVGTGVTELGTNTAISGLGTEAANSLFSAQELFNSYPGAFPSVLSAAEWMVGNGLAGSTTAAMGGAAAAGQALSPSLFDRAGNLLTGAAGTLGTTIPGLLGTGANLLGSYLNGNAATDAAETLAEEQRRIAEMSRFRPVGVTTRFGESQFGYDSKGNLISAGYQLAPDVKAQQDSLMAAAPGMLSQFTGSQAATAPMGEAAQRAMTLGNQYLATSPQEQAAKFMSEQNALLDPGNKAELANLQNKLQAQGRLGLSIGGEGGLMATNPEMAAYQNKLEMQQRQLAAASTAGGQQYANYGLGLVGSGGTMLKDMYGTQTAAYQPYQTAIGGAQNLEGLGQKAMDIGTSIGAQQSTANANVGNMLNTSAQTQAQANAYSPWGGLLSGAGNALAQYQQQQQPQQQMAYNPYTGAKLI